jgi:hypothetical protein
VDYVQLRRNALVAVVGAGLAVLRIRYGVVRNAIPVVRALVVTSAVAANRMMKFSTGLTTVSDANIRLRCSNVVTGFVRPPHARHAYLRE